MVWGTWLVSAMMSLPILFDDEVAFTSGIDEVIPPYTPINAMLFLVITSHVFIAVLVGIGIYALVIRKLVSKDKVHPQQVCHTGCKT